MASKGDSPPPNEVVLRLWTIYYDPADAPRRYVIRGHAVVRGSQFPIPDRKGYAVDTLEAARALVPAGAVCIGRETDDEPHIVETWV